MVHLQTVYFKKDTVEIVDGFISIKKICENLGITGISDQYKKIQSDKTYQSKLKEIEINGIIQKVLCIPLDKLNGWLFSINPSRVKPEVREKLIEYKNECFDVLHSYFNKGYAMQPEVKENLEKKIQMLEAQIQEYKEAIMLQNRLIAGPSQPNIDEMLDELEKRMNEQLQMILNSAMITAKANFRGALETKVMQIKRELSSR